MVDIRGSDEPDSPPKFVMCIHIISQLCYYETTITVIIHVGLLGHNFFTNRL